MDEKDRVRILNLVRRAVVEDPSARARDLYAYARERYPTVEQLDLRQFNARFVLQAKRERGVPNRKRRKAAEPTAAPAKKLPSFSGTPEARGLPQENQPRPANDIAGAKREEPVRTPAHTRRPPLGSRKHRDAVRRVFWDFAEDVASAESAPDVVNVIRRLQSYVDRVMRA